MEREAGPDADFVAAPDKEQCMLLCRINNTFTHGDVRYARSGLVSNVIC